MDYITSNEIQPIVKKITWARATATLPTSCLKKLPAKGLVFMTSLFNFLLRAGYFPLDWKIAIVILIN